MLDVIATIDDLVERKVAVMSTSDGIDPSTREGRLMLNLMATLAEYERGLSREGLQAGVNAARARGVKFGRPSPDLDEVARRVRTVRRLVETDGLTVVAAAKMVGWSRSTYYRHNRR